MSGKGPDLYLVNCSTDGAAQMNEPLFENPYKAMQSGVFASLDKYMKKEVGFENRDRFVELGLMISALRKAKGYTQYELAEKAHISRSHLSSIEAPNISSSFSLEVFFNIADILEVKPGDLLNLNLPSSYFNEDEKQKKLEDK